MTLLRIDKEKCNKDGICSQECPAAIIRLAQEDDGFPDVAEGAEDFCLVCGHCVAVCPQGALDHARVRLDACPPVIRELAISPDQAVQFLRSRRSIRNYKDKPVEKEIIEALIRTARYAPTSGNSQLLHWTVFSQRDDLKKIAAMTVDFFRDLIARAPQGGYPPYLPILVTAWEMGFDAVTRNAPVLLVASAPIEDANGLVDVSISLSYLELAAMAQGLGTCWAGLVQGALSYWPPLKEFVALPEGHEHHYPMMLGHPKFRYHRLPERKAPRIDWR
ncbi:MAG: nitroreductase family protein [Thermodesulfobacteriota bacterium]